MKSIHLPDKPLSVTFQLFRHGAKDSNSNLGREQAAQYGSGLSIPSNTEVRLFSSKTPRAAETTEEVIASCADISKDTETKYVDTLSVKAILSSFDESEFFQRFEKYRGQAQTESSGKDLEKMEEERMKAWLSYVKQPDEGTASPRQVFDDLINFFNTELKNLADDLEENSKVLCLCGTHEFMIAALVHFLTNKKIEEISRIEYLEDVKITVDTINEPRVAIEFRGDEYKIEI